MTPEQQRKRKGQGAETKDEPQILSTAIKSLLMMTLTTCVVTISLYAFFGTGDEVQCGSGISSQICYLPGPDWLGYAVMLSFTLVVISFNCLGNKK